MMELLKERQPLSATRKPPTFQRLRRRAGFWGFEWTNEPHRGGNTSPPDGSQPLRWQPGLACTVKGSLPPERTPRAVIVAGELTTQP